MLFKFLKFLCFHSKSVLVFSFALCLGLSYFAFQLKLDASSSSLFMEKDKDLQVYKEIGRDYPGRDFIVLAFVPKTDPFKNLALIKEIHDKLSKFKAFSEVLDLSNAPLFEQSSLSHPLSLSDPKINIQRAKKEIFSNPFYVDNIISKDGSTTSFIMYTKEGIQPDYKGLRDIAAQYKDKGELILGGVDVIVYDMLRYIKSDLKVYTISLIFMLAIMIYIFFRSFSFIFLSLGICLITLSSCAGLFALMGFKVTIISSNFVALVLIITISTIIHIYVHFLQQQKKYPHADMRKIALIAMAAKAKPCFFAIFTTVIGFLSLVFSDIKPVSELGLMMSIGVALSLIIVYLFLCSSLVYSKRKHFTLHDTAFLKSVAKTAIKHRKSICIVAIGSLFFSAYGLSKLGAENSFVNYFKDSSTIKQGLLLIDQKLGGTMPLDVLITFPKPKAPPKSDDSFEAEFARLDAGNAYFFTPKKLRIAKKVSTYLQNTKFVGKELSLASLVQLGELLMHQKLDSFTLGVLYKNLDPSFKAQILSPYINFEKNQLRFVMRIVDSDKHLKRAVFIKKMREELGVLLKGEDVKYELAGMMVLYNDVLQSIFSSQMESMGFVLLCIFLVFVVIFKSFKYGLYGILASIVPLFFIFAMMGYLGITLDIMSISIGAICIGLGIDDIIHYIDRYNEEVKKGPGAIVRTHAATGSAIYYTSVSLIIGFTMMCTSKFIPIIYFGVLTILVMSLLLCSTLMFLPALLSFKNGDRP